MILRYYAWANRYRGNGHKLAGYFLLGAPLLVGFLAPWLVGYAITGYLHWLPLAVAAITIPLHILIIFKWVWGSEYWPTLGKAGDRKKLRFLWKWKSIVAFGLLGNPFLGKEMERVGDIYFNTLLAQKEDTGLKESEKLSMPVYARQVAKAIAGNAAFVLVFYLVWGLV